MEVNLVCVSGPERSKQRGTITLSIGCFSGWAHGDSEVVLGKENADITIDSHPAATCSRRHAKIFSGAVQAEICIKDLGSSNGTFVNGKRIQESCLRNGDEIIFGGGQSIPIGEHMSSDQLRHPMVTIWRAEIVPLLMSTVQPEAEPGTPFSRQFDSEKENWNIVNSAENENDPDFEKNERDMKKNLESDLHIDRKKTSSLKEGYLSRKFDEIMPRTPHAVRIGTFVTKKINKIIFEESFWKWSQESPNPHEYGQILSFVVHIEEIMSIKYFAGQSHDRSLQAKEAPFYVRIDLHSLPQRVLPEVYVSAMANLRMAGIPRGELAPSIIFYFRKKGEVRSLINSIKENYAGGGMTERIMEVDDSSTSFCP